MLDVAMIERGLKKTGKSKGGLARGNGRAPRRGLGDPVRLTTDEGLGNHADHGIS